MAGIDQKKLDALRKKAGFIKVIVKNGYKEEWITVSELVDAYEALLKFDKAEIKKESVQ